MEDAMQQEENLAKDESVEVELPTNSEKLKDRTKRHYLGLRKYKRKMRN